MDYTKIAKETLQIEADALLVSKDRLGDEIGKCVKIIAKLKGKLIVTGVGKSGLIGAKIAATLASTGTPSFFLHPTEAMHGDLGMIGKGDGILAISFSGESEELVHIMPHVKRFGIPIIAMSRNKLSSLGKHADVHLNIDVQKEACPLAIAPTSSTTLTLALGDAVAMCMMHYRDFQKNDFASFHPGGSLGKQLFVKAKDLMSTEDLPIISEEASLKETLHVMNEGRLGCVLLVDQKGELSAILSDGDLRRAMSSKGFSLDRKAFNYATVSPKVLDKIDTLASDALGLMRNNKITVLAMVNSEKKPIGILHVHDLIEAGIK